MDKQFGDVHISDAGDFVALAEIQRGPNNFFDQALIASLAVNRCRQPLELDTFIRSMLVHRNKDSPWW